LIITITDNGKGFDPQHLTHQDGLGLHNIQQRAALYGGQIEIDTQLNRGTRLTIRIPVQIP
jgi:signal transduction histidine kinase